MQTWPTYVRAIAGNINSAIARTTGLSQPSVSRWFKGSLPDPSSAATFARKYDRPVLEAFIAQALADNPKSAEDFRAGKKAAAGFIVGQVMKLSKGKADPKQVGRLVAERLTEGR